MKLQYIHHIFFTPAFMLSQLLLSIPLSRQRVDEFEIERDLVDGPVLVT